MQPYNISVTEACRMTGLGRTSINKLISKKEISSLKVGKRRLISLSSVMNKLIVHDDIG
jgi:excisionase family DNA binding protein